MSNHETSDASNLDQGEAGDDRVDKFDAADKLGECPELGQNHRMSNIYLSTDGQTWGCVHCDKEVPKNV